MKILYWLFSWRPIAARREAQRRQLVMMVIEADDRTMRLQHQINLILEVLAKFDPGAARELAANSAFISAVDQTAAMVRDLDVRAAELRKFFDLE